MSIQCSPGGGGGGGERDVFVLVELTTLELEASIQLHRSINFFKHYTIFYTLLSIKCYSMENKEQEKPNKELLKVLAWKG